MTTEGKSEMSKTIEEKIEQFPATELSFDETLLGEREKQVLKKLVEAARYMDQIFLRQVSPRNPEWLAQLEASKTRDEALLHYFRIMFGPWDRLEEHKAFMGAEDKPLGAGFYPPDLTREEFEGWLAEHPQDREAFTSYYTAIKRKGDELVAVPYSIAYEEFLEPAAGLLEEAARISDNPSLARFLKSRAEAFRSNDYLQSEIDWMDIKDSAIDVTIGPYEVYEDRLLGYKASFEAFIAIKDPAESEKLEILIRYLPEMEENLPGAAEYEPVERGGSSPISVVSEILCAGEAKAGVQAFAFVLPNDERVRQAKGSKKVMLKNVGEAKSRKCGVPTAERIIVQGQLPLLDFDVYFNYVLMHELAHSMGPGIIKLPDGSETTVGLALKELGPTIEEAKADLAGICDFLYLINKGVLSGLEELCVGYAVSLFHSIRFGIDQAHGRAALTQLNFVLERGGLVYDESSRKFSVDFARLQEAVRELTKRVLMLQAQGSYQGVKELLDTYGVVTPLLEQALASVTDIPVDIEPLFPIVARMQDW
jgi:hypothetical protein